VVLIRLFLAVAEERSFTRAARRLEITPTAVSKGVRALEKQHGVPLFVRTTRSVSMTDAGAVLMAALKPAVGQIDDAFAELERLRSRPAGHLRITAPRAFGFLLARLLAPRMRAAYPDISFELSLDDGLVDVAAPAYFAQAGIPEQPQELLRHRTLRYRFNTSSRLPPWRLLGPDGELLLDTGTALTADDTRMLAEWARQGLGMAYLPDLEIAEDLRRGALQRVLAPFVPATSGLFLYFPMRTQHQPKMRALIEQAARLAEEGALDASCR